MAHKQFELPTLVFGSVELHRLQREMEALEEYMIQADIRTPGKQAPLPKMSRFLEAVADNNDLHLLKPEDRKQLSAVLKQISETAPTIHISFAADPSAAFTAKVVGWFRTNIHPHSLIQVGLQPGIAAGCIVRTNNKSFDFSLRNRFFEKRDFLTQSIEGKTSA